MRILWVSHIIPYPPKSGVHLRSYNLLRAVAMQNEVDLVAFVQEPWLEIFYKSREEAIEDCGRHLRQFCRSVRFVSIEKLARPLGKVRTALEGLFFPECYTIRWLQGNAAWKLFADLSQSETYDLVHFDTLSLAPFRPLFSKIPATLGHHNVESQILHRRAQNEASWLKRLYFNQESRRVRSYEARVAYSFGKHIACSELDCERLRAIAPRISAVTIPNGVDVEYFCPSGIAPTNKSLIFVGSLNWYPNVDAVLFLLGEVWPLLQARVPDARLDIVGSAPPASVLRLAASLTNVRVHGFVNDVRPLIEGAAVYVCPIRDGGGTKLKLLDAFAMEKCVVAHPISCEGIKVISQRHVLLAETASAFADSIQTVLENRTLRESLGKAARELVVNSYSFAQIGRQLCVEFDTAARSGAESLLRADGRKENDDVGATQRR
jgi:glycosyltransferase involved in cell wall biosynthesis